MIAFRHSGAEYGSGRTGVPDATAEETAYVKAEVDMDRESGAYFRLQLTRPETIAYALTDSPLGWAAGPLTCSINGRNGLTRACEPSH
jgi:hypothetical protein